MVQVGEVMVEAQHSIEHAMDVVRVPVVEGGTSSRVAPTESVHDNPRRPPRTCPLGGGSAATRALGGGATKAPLE